MVIIDQPNYLIQNGNNYAILVRRVNVITGAKFYFVSADALGNILGPQRAFQYGNQYNTRSEAINNTPPGWSQVNPVTPVSLSIALNVIVFQDVRISIFGGVSPWVLEVNTGSGWTVAQTLTTLPPNQAGTNNPSANGELLYLAPASGTYQFRVISGGITSNSITATALLQGGGGVVNPPAGERILMIGYLHFISVANYIQLVDEHMARGFNAIYVNNQPMDTYFLTWTDFQNNNEFINSNNEFSGKTWDNWLLPILTHIRNTYPTIPVMIKHMANMSPWPALQNNPENVGKDPWWPADHSVTDQFGFIANNQGSGIRRSPSFASTIARTRVAAWANWMNARIQSVLNSGQLRYISYGTANTVELGFSQNATSFSNDGVQQSALRFFHGDYSAAATASYRQYLQGKYATIAAVNTAHAGPNWNSFADIQPPTSASAPQPDPNNNTDIVSWWYEVYLGQRGQDWAQSRIRDIIRFVEALPIPPGVERVLEPGHIAYSFSHMTVGGAPKLMRQRLGKIKVAQESRDIEDNIDIHADLFQSHVGQEMWGELAVFDAKRRVNEGTAPSFTHVINQFAQRYEQTGAGYLLIITAPNEQGYAEFRDFWNTTRAAQFKSGPSVPNPDMSNWPVANISFEEWSTIPNILSDRWIAAGGSNANRIRINFTEPTIVGL